MNQSVLYTNNGNLTTVQGGNSIPLGEIRRRTGNQLTLGPSGILVSGKGYFKLEAMVVNAVQTTGQYTVSWYIDGEPVAGATATIDGTADENSVVTIPAVIRKRHCDTAVVTLRYTGDQTNIVNVSVVAERV